MRTEPRIKAPTCPFCGGTTVNVSLMGDRAFCWQGHAYPNEAAA